MSVTVLRSSSERPAQLPHIGVRMGAIAKLATVGSWESQFGTKALSEDHHETLALSL